VYRPQRRHDLTVRTAVNARFLLADVAERVLVDKRPCTQAAAPRGVAVVVAPSGLAAAGGRLRAAGAG